MSLAALPAFLRIMGAACLAASALHLVLGLRADLLLGVSLPPGVVANPGLDSQNRFYGTAFALYGVLLWVCASDVTKYSTVLRCTAWMVFAGGLARLVSISLYGLPPAKVIALLLSELVIPPIIVWWIGNRKAGA